MCCSCNQNLSCAKSGILGLRCFLACFLNHDKSRVYLGGAAGMSLRMAIYCVAGPLRVCWCRLPTNIEQHACFKYVASAPSACARASDFEMRNWGSGRLHRHASFPLGAVLIITCTCTGLLRPPQVSSLQLKLADHTRGILFPRQSTPQFVDSTLFCSFFPLPSRSWGRGEAAQPIALSLRYSTFQLFESRSYLAVKSSGLSDES